MRLALETGSMRTIIIICTLGLLTAACATTSQTADTRADIADTEAARLAAMLATELDRRARTASGSLELAQGEMRALEAALFPAPPIAEPAVVPADDTELTMPEAVSDARSLYHAIHIASYRDRETAREGWRTLRAMFPDVLGHLTARIEPVDIDGQGHFLRLKAGPFLSSQAAGDACAPFRAASVWCATVDFTGDALEIPVTE